MGPFIFMSFPFIQKVNSACRLLVNTSHVCRKWSLSDQSFFQDYYYYTLYINDINLWVKHSIGVLRLVQPFKMSFPITKLSIRIIAGVNKQSLQQKCFESAQPVTMLSMYLYPQKIRKPNLLEEQTKNEMSSYL